MLNFVFNPPSMSWSSVMQHELGFTLGRRQFQLQPWYALWPVPSPNGSTSQQTRPNITLSWPTRQRYVKKSTEEATIKQLGPLAPDRLPCSYGWAADRPRMPAELQRVLTTLASAVPCD